MTAAPTRFAAGARSHAGMVRDNNEDAYVAQDGVFVVADGMGGHQAGEVASAMAVEALRAAGAEGFASVTDVERAVRDANSAIRGEAADARERAGMGTTITGLLALELSEDDPTPRLAVTNVGDSRTYLHRDRGLFRLTVDHSYVQELVRTGQISEQEARFHPRRNIVTRALGIDHNIAVDAWVRACVRGDRYLVCSDGLVDEVPDHEIAAVLEGVADPQAAADQLVEMANRHGGRDNTTVIVVDVLDGLDTPPADDVLPASAIDDGGLPTEIHWAETSSTDSADTAPSSANRTQVMPVTAVMSPSSTTSTAPVAASTVQRRRFGVPQLLFLLALGAILTVVVVVVALAVQSEPDAPVDPVDSSVVTTAPSTTAVASTTRVTITTTAPATTTVTVP